MIRHNVGFMFSPALAHVGSIDRPLHASRFVAPVNTAIEDYTPDFGNAWVRGQVGTPAVLPNTIRIVAQNRLRIFSDSQAAVTDLGVSTDYRASIDVIANAGLRMGLVVRWDSDGNAITFRIRNPESIAELVSWAAGAPTVIADQAITPLSGLHVLEVQLSGNDYTCLIDDVPTVTGTSALYSTATSVGVTSFNADNNERYDNFLARTLT